MQLTSVMLVGFGLCFVMLAALQVHERFGDGEKTPMNCLRTGLDKAVSCTMLDYDRDPVFGSAVPLILFFMLPGAAALNALLGGSPMLIFCYGLIVLSVFAHLFFAENPSMAPVLGMLSVAAALFVLIFVPYYAVWSLSEHQMHGLPAQAALSGLLICVILYAGNAGFWSLLRTGIAGMCGARAERFLAAFLFALPFGYVLFWFVLLVVNMIAGEAVASGYRDWPTLLCFDLTAGFVFAVFKMLTGVHPSPESAPGKWATPAVTAVLGISALLFGLYA